MNSKERICMLHTDKIHVRDILFVNRSSDSRTGMHIFKMESVYHYQLLYKLSGEAVVTFNGKTLREKAGDVRFLPSPALFGRVPDYRADVIEICESINIGFTSDSPLPKEILVKNYSNHTALKTLFQKLHTHWFYKRSGYYHKSLSILYEIFYELSKSESSQLFSGTYKLIVPAVDYIERRFTQVHIDGNYLAGLCGISYTYMSQIFNKYFGLSPSRYITTKKIQYACELLNTKCYPIGTVAEMCGFPNTYYFSRIFKKHTGLCPSEYNNARPCSNE